MNMQQRTNMNEHATNMNEHATKKSGRKRKRDEEQESSGLTSRQAEKESNRFSIPTATGVAP